jgi:hypothetical protein
MNDKYNVEIKTSKIDTKSSFPGCSDFGLSLTQKHFYFTFNLAQIFAYAFTGFAEAGDFSSCPVELFENVLLYNASNEEHQKAALSSPYPLKFYYTNNNNAVGSHSNYVLIQGKESFAEFQQKWQERLQKIIHNKKIEAWEIPIGTEIPAQLICPITKKLFVDPVIVPETYKKLFSDHPEITVVERAVLELRFNSYNNLRLEVFPNEVLPFVEVKSAENIYQQMLAFRTQHGVCTQKTDHSYLASLSTKKLLDDNLEPNYEIPVYQDQSNDHAQKILQKGSLAVADFYNQMLALRKISDTKISPLSTLRPSFLNWEDLLNPSHFVLLSFVLFLASSLSPAALLLSSAIAGFLAVPIGIGYLAVKIYKDYQQFNEKLWNPLVDAVGFPQANTRKTVYSLQADPVIAQRAMQQEINDLQAYKEANRWKVLAYLKALPARLYVWAQNHRFQASFVFISLVIIAAMFISAFTSTPWMPLDFISQLFSNGIHAIIAWSPDKLAFLHVLATETATHIMAIGVVIIGALSVCDNTRRIGRAAYTMYGNLNADFNGVDEGDLVELQLNTTFEGNYDYSNPVANSYIHTLNWRQQLVSDEVEKKETKDQVVLKTSQEYNCAL